jgi:hypothetical protein
MDVKNEILNIYNKLKIFEINLYNTLNCPEIFIDELLMFISIYSQYNFKNNGCPYYEINQVLTYIPDEIYDILKTINTNIDIDFKPVYNEFLQEMYDLLFEWVFSYNVSSTKIRKIKLNIKININKIICEIYNNKPIQQLIEYISDSYNVKPFNIIIKKNNMTLDSKKKLLEYKLDETSSLTLYINQFSRLN